MRATVCSRRAAHVHQQVFHLFRESVIHRVAYCTRIAMSDTLPRPASRRKPQTAFRLAAPLLDQLDSYRTSLRVRTSRTAVLETALSEFLEREIANQQTRSAS